MNLNGGSSSIASNNGSVSCTNSHQGSNSSRANRNNHKDGSPMNSLVANGLNHSTSKDISSHSTKMNNNLHAELEYMQKKG